MMSYIWGIMTSVSVIGGILTGQIDNVANAAMSGAADAVSLFLTVGGMMCLWSGLMKIAHESGITKAFSWLISPILKLLFTDVSPNSNAAGALSMSIAANFLGLGSAATPLGLAAMKELAKNCQGTATDSMVMLVVLNTASIQLIPTTIAVYRASAGSASPLCILPCVWISSIASVTAGITMAKILSKRTQ